MRKRLDDATQAERIRRAAAIAQSASTRYPRELWNSLKNPDREEASDAQTLRESAGAVDPKFEGPLAVSWLGHATVLLHMGGRWVLTDPVFSRRIGVRVGPWTFGMERLQGPHIRARDLPQLDVILVSHAHFDHLDKPSLKKLVNKDTLVVTAQHTGRLIPRGFGEVLELGWGRDLRLGKLQIRALRPAHWGARTGWDRHRGYNSYVVDSPEHSVLFAGDTGMTDAFKPVGEAGGVELGIFGIGAYDPWEAAHATPEQVWKMAHDAGARYLLPIHHSTFKLSNEPADEPLRRLLAAAGDGCGRVIRHAPGELWIPSKVSGESGLVDPVKIGEIRVGDDGREGGLAGV